MGCCDFQTGNFERAKTSGEATKGAQPFGVGFVVMDFV